MYRAELDGGDPHRRARTRRFRAGRIAALVVALAAAGCQERSASEADTAARPPEVGIVVVEPRPVELVKELPGRITPMRIAEVRARVSGIVVERAFTQGSLVKAGDVLYRIDPRPFEVELESNRAALARAEATLFQASRQEDRLRVLLGSQTTSQAQYDAALAAERQAEADVAAQKAAVRRASRSRTGPSAVTGPPMPSSIS